MCAAADGSIYPSHASRKHETSHRRREVSKADHIDFDRINRRTYQTRSALRQMEAATDWLEPGERLAFELIADCVRDGAILDIGVGGGRTAPLMLAISRNYCAIDYSPAMASAARKRFPTLRILEMDARRLSFPANSFDLAAFSYNGIDSVDLTGRLEILRGVHRVLRLGGFFVFSALNREGPAHEDHWPDFHVFRDAGLSPNRLLHAAARFMLSGANWLRLHPLAKEGDDVAIGHISAHNFGLITLFTSLRAQLGQLGDAGFRVEAIFEPDGRRIAADGSEPTHAPWCHFVACKTLNAP